MAELPTHQRGGYALSAAKLQPDSDGYHFVTGFDGTRLRFKLLGGGPRGDHSFDARRRTAILLHGMGDSLSWWDDAVFRTKGLPEDYVPFGGGIEATRADESVPSEEARRAKFVQALGRRMNVVLVDQRGFGGSGRPRSLVALKDDNVTVLNTWKVHDGEGFTRAIKLELACSKAVGAASHSISVSGSTALVRVTFRSVASLQLHRFQSEGFPKLDRMDSHCTLQATEIIASSARLAEIQRLPESQAVRGAALLRNSTESFAQDSGGSLPTADGVLVIHRLRLNCDDVKIAGSSDQFVDEVKDNDAACLSFSVSRMQGHMVALGLFQGPEAALAHLQRFQQWFEREDGGLCPALLCELTAVQLHARPSLLKMLRAVPEISESVQLFQFFPLSFEDSKATEESATVHDFVTDVESIRSYTGASQVTIVGHSMGAAIALQYAVTYPERIERLCVCAAAPRVGKAAHDYWMNTAGDIRSWDQNVMRTTVAVVLLDDKKLQQLEVPCLLINAKDDTLTPVVGSEMIRGWLPTSLLYVPDVGGHDCLVANPRAMERMVRFLMADEAMLFAEDPLFAEQLVSRWNLPGDKAFVRYYNCGIALAEVERLERRLRMTKKQLAFAAYEREGMQQVLRGLRLDTAGSSSATPREQVMTEMMEMVGAMSAPAREVVQQAGVWWRDSGAAHGAGDGTKYTVDAFGRRRGKSKHGCCAWYRWDLGLVPAVARSGLMAGLPPKDMSPEIFMCGWCGGPPSAHEDLGPAGENEEMGFFPGLGPGRQAFKQQASAREVPAEASDDGAMRPRFNRTSLAEGAHLQPVSAK